ncbi:hypothetical protein [Streptomyces sp. AK02-01A]|uniref:hypothetical protein n=1 Tax=Streptomyces sp. AK02-01A TaxID=3028648 RepID=UPI0029A14D3C|nr:hypothetical protein [Streptomyces sp. AK02-01A]MDX3853496.1 hypothetical protein [Streptomyces sp. AK02-01A]
MVRRATSSVGDPSDPGAVSRILTTVEERLGPMGVMVRDAATARPLTIRDPVPGRD